MMSSANIFYNHLLLQTHLGKMEWSFLMNVHFPPTALYHRLIVILCHGGQLNETLTLALGPGLIHTINTCSNDIVIDHHCSAAAE
jgi:hypothetical protein